MVETGNLYRIIAAEVISFDILPKVGILFQAALLDYDIEQEQKLNVEKHLLIFNNTVTIRVKETEEQLVTMKAVIIFEIHNFEKVVMLPEPNQFTLPREMNNSMSRIAIGVTRGMLAGKLKGTYIPNAILPLLPFEY